MKHIHEFKDSIPSEIIDFAKLWYCTYHDFFPLTYDKETGKLFYRSLNGLKIAREITTKVFKKWFIEHPIDKPTHDHSHYILNVSKE